MGRKVSKIEEVMDFRIKVLNVNGTENIQLFRGDEFIGLDNVTDYEREILSDIMVELDRDAPKKPKSIGFEERLLREAEGDIEELLSRYGIAYARGSYDIDVKDHEAKVVIGTKIKKYLYPISGTGNLMMELTIRGWMKVTNFDLEYDHLVKQYTGNVEEDYNGGK